MSIIYVLIPIAMIFVLVAVAIFFWAVKSDQFDDLEKQSVSILFEDDDAEVKQKPDNQQMIKGEKGADIGANKGDN
ncbi:cytochrome oxidase maturation protein Cbb3 [Shewanella sairae]|uniref:Cytochrome oxidase maturation protein Cbb3 n=1 Tax=Shewanella sairae TaxID=190310 RepID=A0ABQ4PK21_9GAMM|nr:cbb3-type cytochrome oxidase assembly protein CcoS [Shewanella sairae]MCL1129900.1 cbb3-type cytochrome oxidase assembly protein CcoS [Shewanella sairae]GIU47983.1 cytochrome oxidase maturation protein Cbb3 [Shewanella sairae]